MYKFFSEKLLNWTDAILVCVCFMVVHLTFYFGATYAPTENPKLYLVLLCVTFTILFRLITTIFKPVVIKWNWWTVCISVYALSLILSTINSPDPIRAIFGHEFTPSAGLVAFFTLALVVFYLPYITIQDLPKKVLILLSLGGSAIAIIGILQHFGTDLIRDWPPQVSRLRSSSTIGNPVPYAMYLSYTLIATSVLFYFYNSNRHLQFLMGFQLVIQSLGIWYSGSRAPIFFTAVLFLINALSILAHRKKLKLSLNALHVFAPLFLMIFVWVLSTKLEKSSVVIDRVTRHSTIDSIGSRLSIGVSGATASLQERPILGFGPGMFSYIYGKVKPPEHNRNLGWSETFLLSHNEVAEIITAQGLIGLMVYVFLLTLFLFSIVKFILNPDFQPNHLFQLGIVSIFASCILNTQLMFNYFSTLLIYLVLPVFLFQVRNFQVSERRVRPGLQFFAKCSVCVILISFLIHIMPSLIGNFHLMYATREVERFETDKALQHTAKAIDANPIRLTYQCVIVSAYANIGSKKHKELLWPSNIKAIEVATKNCIAGNKYNAVGLFALAEQLLYISTFNSSFEKPAFDLFDQAIALSPNELRIQSVLAERLIERKNYERAFSIALSGLTSRPEDLKLRGIALLSSFELKRFDEAKRLVSELEELYKAEFPFVTPVETELLLSMKNFCIEFGDLESSMKLNDLMEFVKKKKAS